MGKWNSSDICYYDVNMLDQNSGKLTVKINDLNLSFDYYFMIFHKLDRVKDQYKENYKKN